MKYLLLILILVGGCCEECCEECGDDYWDGGSDTDTDTDTDTEADASVPPACVDGQEKCADNVVCECVDGEWQATEWCTNEGLVCTWLPDAWIAGCTEPA
jgi:hypothetical protein